MIPITEIHPMLVHFPIVLWINAELLSVGILLRGGNLSGRQTWPVVAFYSLLAGTAFAVVAAVFGDIALDRAVAAGFDAGPLEIHETVAITTICIFGLHALLRWLGFRFGYSLTGKRGWLAEIPGLIGIIGLFVTAYLGGELVYQLGVNVATTVH